MNPPSCKLCGKNSCMEGFWYLCQKCLENKYYKKIKNKKCFHCKTKGTIKNIPRRYMWIPPEYAIGYSVDKHGDMKINRCCMGCYKGRNIDPHSSTYLTLEIQELHNKIDFLKFDLMNTKIRLEEYENNKIPKK